MHASLQTFDWQQAIESSSIFDLVRLAFQPRLQPTNLAIPQNAHPRLVVLILYDGINNRHSNICTRSCWHLQFFLRVCWLITFPGISLVMIKTIYRDRGAAEPVVRTGWPRTSSANAHGMSG